MKREWIANVSLLFTAFIWGATFVVVQNAIDIVEPFTFNAIRFLAAGLFLLIIGLLTRKRAAAAFPWKGIGPGLLIGLLLFGGYLLQTFGLLYTTSSKAGFLTGLSMIMVPLFSFVLLKQKTGLFTFIGVAAATAGLFLLTAESSFSLNKGDVLVLFCAVSFALHIIVNGIFSHMFSSLFLSTVQILAVGTFSTICALLFEDWERVLSLALWKNGSFLFAILLTALFATSLAFFIQTAAQKMTSPTRVAVILAMEPVFAALTAVIAAGEHLSATAIIGCGCMLLGMIVAELPGKQNESARAAA